jgi:membrane dipeptidase
MDEQASKLHRDSIVIDGLNISRWGEPDVYRHLHEGGLTAVHASLATWETKDETLKKIGQMYRDFEQFKEWIRPVHRIADIHAAKEENRVGLFFGFQNSSPLEGDLDMVEIFHRLGVRIIQITYNDLNYAGAGCYERQDIGLSQFGVELVEEMNRLGMVVDLSHVGYKTTMEAIETSKDPVWFSHANPSALYEHVRNKTDEQVQALVAKGGVVGANIFPPFLKKGQQSTIEDLLDILDHWVRIAGIDHVSIGLDYTEKQPAEWFQWLMKGKRRDDPIFNLDLPLQLPKGIERADQFPNITEGLLGRGYAPADVQKILGGNILRLFHDVWKE